MRQVLCSTLFYHSVAEQLENKSDKTHETANCPVFFGRRHKYRLRLTTAVGIPRNVPPIEEKWRANTVKWLEVDKDPQVSCVN